MSQPIEPSEIGVVICTYRSGGDVAAALRACAASGISDSQITVVDNGSDDGTLELLLAQPDVHVFSSLDSYAANTMGMAWTNAILEAFADDQWALIVDADELFIYPRYEQVSLCLLYTSRCV